MDRRGTYTYYPINKGEHNSGSKYLKYLDRLSDQQLEAIKDVDGATLLLAVPGSGKTTTLIARIAKMIYEHSISPKSILVITFTNGAANEMKQRFSSEYGEKEASEILFCTINSLCYSIVRDYERVSGHKKPDDDTDSLKNIRKLYNKVYGEGYPDENEIRDLATQITYIKNSNLKVGEIERLVVDDLSVKKMYDAYCEYMNTYNKMDYDDQIVYANKILSGNLYGVGDYYSNKYKYILVDEAQDTSWLQHNVIRLLTKGNNNIFMVGDEDQSIYGFRAAYPKALLDFGKTYPNSKVYYLETNYRSGKKIVAAASNLIAHNKQRYKKRMVAVNEDNHKIKLRNFNNRIDQYSQMIDVIKQSPEEQTAILFRNNDSALPFISFLQRENMSYTLGKTDSLFFENKIVKDAIDIIDFAYNPTSKKLLWELYYKFDIRITKKLLWDATHDLPYRSAMPLLEVVYRHPNLSKSKQSALRRLIMSLDEIRHSSNAREAIRILRTKTGYKNSSSEKLFIMEAMTYEDETIWEFIRRLQRVKNSIEKGNYDRSSNIILSTIHSSKGKEYEKVIIADAIKGILPSSDNDIEEERRIFYVGITRAIHKLEILTYKDYPTVFAQELNPIQTRGKKFNTDFAIGDIVQHAQFGVGKVTMSNEAIIAVNFARVGKKVLSKKLVQDNNLLKKI